MGALREDQERLIAVHRERGTPPLETLAAAAARGDPRRTNEWQQLLDEPPKRLVSVAVCAVEARCEYSRAVRGAEAGSAIWAGPSAAVPFLVLKALRKRRLPWRPEDAELMLDLAAGADIDVLAFAVGAAEHVLAAHPGEPRVYRALDAARRAVDVEMRRETGAAGRLRQRMRALVAAHAPGALLDLTLLQAGDAWADRAAAAAREHAARWEGTQQLLAHLAAARGARPASRWLATVEAILESSPEAGSLVRALLVPLYEAEVAPGSRLLAPANERVVCGAAWAAGLLRSADAVQLLNDVALACMGPAPVAARAAVEALILAGTDEARAALRSLLPQASRVTVRERIAEVVVESPTPKRRRAEGTRAFAQRFLDALADAGFTDRAAREAFRHSHDRVEVASVRSEAAAPLLELGVAFAAPRGGALGRPKAYLCDLNGRARRADDDVEAAARHALAWFEHWRDASVVVDFHLAGVGAEEVEGFKTTGSRGPDNPGCNLIVGYLAAEAGRPELVRPCLESVAAHYRDIRAHAAAPDPGLDARIDRIEGDARRLAP